jgi:hypothetical protein
MLLIRACDLLRRSSRVYGYCSTALHISDSAIGAGTCRIGVLSINQRTGKKWNYQSSPDAPMTHY